MIDRDGRKPHDRYSTSYCRDHCREDAQLLGARGDDATILGGMYDHMAGLTQLAGQLAA
jgi:hypothetical protein